MPLGDARGIGLDDRREVIESGEDAEQLAQVRIVVAELGAKRIEPLAEDERRPARIAANRSVTGDSLAMIATEFGGTVIGRSRPANARAAAIAASPSPRACASIARS